MQPASDYSGAVEELRHEVRQGTLLESEKMAINMVGAEPSLVENKSLRQIKIHDHISYGYMSYVQHYTACSEGHRTSIRCVPSPNVLLSNWIEKTIESN